MQNKVEIKAKSHKRFVKGPVKMALAVINKLSGSAHKKIHPCYLRWLGVDLFKDSTGYDDSWISSEHCPDAGGCSLIARERGANIFCRTSVLVYGIGIGKVLFARRSEHK